MKFFAIIFVACAISGCHQGAYRPSEEQPRVYLGPTGGVSKFEIDGVLYSPRACGQTDNPCTASVKSGRLLDQTAVTISVFETDNPQCCYTFDRDGYSSEICLPKPEGLPCPILK